jgi:sucrose phosphorylase
VTEAAREAGTERKSWRRHLHRKEPDYSRPLLDISPEQRAALLDKLTFLYGRERAEPCYLELERILRVYYAHKTPEMIEDEKDFDPAERFTERDVILITYGDMVRSPGKKPLQALSDLAQIFFQRLINTIHILPFFPYSSDRGFAVIDFEEVDPNLGSWDEIERLSENFRLMFDGVINHVSSKSRWFQQFLNGNPHYQRFFTTFSTKQPISDEQLKLILRPRTTPLLTTFQTIHGPKLVWTTFGPDQVDLSFKYEQVLLRILEILLMYVRRGADIIRLDAVTYLWEELGTSSAHLQQTHCIVQLFRQVLDLVAPHVALLTETNVPHEDNVRYFGDGRNEAQMVYNFALPPLVLLAFLKGDCARLTDWAASLERVSDTATYFNFLDSHDGVGVLPVKNLVSPEEVDALVEHVRAHGGLVSYRDTGDGGRAPYELNVTWFNALNKEDSEEDVVRQVERFVASRAIALALRGVPGIYLLGLVGGQNDQEAVRQTGVARDINRATIFERKLFELLGDEGCTCHQIARRFFRLLEVRTASPAFHPNAGQRILRGNPAVFAVLRIAKDGRQAVLALTNVSDREQAVSFSEKETGVASRLWRDLLSERGVEGRDGRLETRLAPYEVLWLTPEQSG